MKVTRHAKLKLLKEKGISEERITEEVLQLANWEILDLFNGAVEESAKDNPGLVRRIIDNQFEECQYFLKGKWRLVVCGDTIVTVEKNKFKKKKKKGRRR
jgi:hypothetical protein